MGSSSFSNSSAACRSSICALSSQEELVLTSAAAAAGPVNLCRFADAVLDACLAQDPTSKVACETAVKDNFLLVGHSQFIARVLSQAPRPFCLMNHLRNLCASFWQRCSWCSVLAGFQLALLFSQQHDPTFASWLNAAAAICTSLPGIW